MKASTRNAFLVLAVPGLTWLTLMQGVPSQAAPAQNAKPIANKPAAVVKSSGAKKAAVKSAKAASPLISAQKLKQLEKDVQQNPNSCEARLCLGKAYMQCKQFPKAKEQLQKAVRVGKGSPNAVVANKLLMTMPRDLTAPRFGAGTAMIASANGLRFSARGEGGASKPVVINFFAKWCQPCTMLDKAIKKAQASYGDQVEFLSVDVDDPAKERLLEQYDVSPIPTVIFLDNSGEVVSYSIGYSGDESIVSGIKKILPSG
jgi:thioredoxin 1